MLESGGHHSSLWIWACVRLGSDNGGTDQLANQHWSNNTAESTLTWLENVYRGRITGPIFAICVVLCCIIIHNLSLAIVSGFPPSAPVCCFPTLPRMTSTNALLTSEGNILWTLHRIKHSVYYNICITAFIISCKSYLLFLAVCYDTICHTDDQISTWELGTGLGVAAESPRLALSLASGAFTMSVFGCQILIVTPHGVKR